MMFFTSKRFPVFPIIVTSLTDWSLHWAIAENMAEPESALALTMTLAALNFCLLSHRFMLRGVIITGLCNFLDLQSTLFSRTPL